MTLDELIAALELAGGPSRELDEAVCLAVYPWLVDLPRTDVGGWLHPKDGKIAPPPAYTTSLDAAITLVPEAPWPWNITMATAYGSASVMPCDGKSTGIHDPRGGHARNAATPALALTIAALKARTP